MGVAIRTRAWFPSRAVDPPAAADEPDSAPRTARRLQAPAKEDVLGVSVRNLTKSYGAFEAVKDASFEAPGGRLVALLGPSGSGKSTILRTIAGLEAADSGRVLLGGEDATRLPAQHRGIGFVFQHYALFRHMTVRDNVGFGLKIRKAPRGEIRRRVDELLDLVQLSGHAGRYPSQLSGGQRQRVALARALAPRPKVLLLDEPLGALDAQVRDELRSWLRKLHDELHVTSLLVTHDQREAFEIADRIVVLADGRVQQIGSPQDLYERPSNPFVARFLGAVNILPLQLLEPGEGRAGLAELLEAPAGERVEVYVRPHDFDVRAEPDGKPRWVARVDRTATLGGVLRLDLLIDRGVPVQVELPHDQGADPGFRRGDAVYLTPRHLNVFDRSRGVFRHVDVHRALGEPRRAGAGV